MAHTNNELSFGPIIAGPGLPPIAAVGKSLVVHEWAGAGPSYMHIHRSDDEAWHVLEGSLRFRFADRGRRRPRRNHRLRARRLAAHVLGNCLSPAVI